MVQCICEICICGRHHCEHTKNRVPYAKDKDVICKLSEHKDRFKPFCCQSRPQPIIPASGADWTGTEPPVKISTTKRDYVSYPIQKRTLKKSRAAYKEPRGKMIQFTTYKNDFKPKQAEVRKQFRVAECPKDGTMPGTLPGRMESETTYGNNYVARPCSRREQAKVKECTLTKLGQPFAGTTETKLCYQPPSYSKREKVLPRKGQLKPASGSFENQTTHKIDFPPKYVEPAKPIKTKPKWKPSNGAFRGTTTHAHDYKCPPPTQRREMKLPQESVHKTQAPFEGISNYKHDYPAHDVTIRKLPQWHPASRPYKKSEAPPMSGRSTYKTDFEALPEEHIPERPRPMKDNLVLPSGSMEKVTSSMRDYKRIDHPVKTRSCKPDAQYKKPEGEFANCTTTKCDYTAKTGDRAEISKAADSLRLKEGVMEDRTTTRTDYQWTNFDCPAKYLKLYGKDALPQYQFVEKDEGHDYFKKLKKKSEISN